MNWKTIGLTVLLADFAAFSAWVVYQHGYVGLFAAMLANTATMQVGLDLVLALSMVAVWLHGDARARGINPVPFLLLTATLGSIGPLLYLVLRERIASVAPGRVRVAAA